MSSNIYLEIHKIKLKEYPIQSFHFTDENAEMLEKKRIHVFPKFIQLLTEFEFKLMAPLRLLLLL
jgi:hypothetical protein